MERLSVDGCDLEGTAPACAHDDILVLDASDGVDMLRVRGEDADEGAVVRVVQPDLPIAGAGHNQGVPEMTDTEHKARRVLDVLEERPGIGSHRHRNDGVDGVDRADGVDGVDVADERRIRPNGDFRLERRERSGAGARVEH